MSKYLISVNLNTILIVPMFLITSIKLLVIYYKYCNFFHGTKANEVQERAAKLLDEYPLPEAGPEYRDVHLADKCN